MRYKRVQIDFQTENWYVSDLDQLSEDNVEHVSNHEIIYYIKYDLDQPIYFFYSIPERMNVIF